MLDLSVVELGDRIACGACGSLLATMGAQVTLVEPASPGRGGKWLQRDLAAVGKRSVRRGTHDAALAELLAGADVVIASSDTAPLPAYWHAPAQIVCDITAYGSSGPLAHRADPDVFVQALSGLVDTTGEPDSAPRPIGFPVTEAIAGLYATAGILAALRVRARDGLAQDIDIALYDCAFSTLTTFLPFHFAGLSTSRSGNQHSLIVPWNAYRAQDGWLIVCAGSDAQWLRLCQAMDMPALGDDERFRTASARQHNRDAADALVARWVAAQPAERCIATLQPLGIACGPILRMDQIEHEPNLVHRGTVTRRRKRTTGHSLLVPGTVIKALRHPLPGAHASHIQDHAPPAAAIPASQRVPARAGEPPALPLAGIKVLEIGQYTTAPLAARLLGALGADVLKVEPPRGDVCRHWSPHQDHQSHFFSLSNSGKSSLCVDLRSRAGQEQFARLLRDADVLVENMKPGSLERLGFGPRQLHALNPRLVYCALSGFGHDSAYPGRAAYDSVVQAMSGAMDLNQVDGVPQKAGISAADIAAALFGLIAIEYALHLRTRDGAGDQLDVSMQDATAWLTHWCWNARDTGAAVQVLRCLDGGSVLIVGEQDPHALATCGERAACGALPREGALAHLAGLGIAAVPVLTVAEAASSEQTRARDLLLPGVDSLGRHWTLLSCPIGLRATPPRVAHTTGPLGEANATALRTSPSAAP